MKYLLKLAKGHFEEVSRYTFDNREYALADDGGTRYEPNNWVIVSDDNSISAQLNDAGSQDLAILVRGLNLPAAPPATIGGFIKEEPPFIKFVKGKTTSMLETKTGVIYKVSKAA